MRYRSDRNGPRRLGLDVLTTRPIGERGLATAVASLNPLLMAAVSALGGRVVAWGGRALHGALALALATGDLAGLAQLRHARGVFQR